MRNRALPGVRAVPWLSSRPAAREHEASPGCRTGLATDPGGVGRDVADGYLGIRTESTMYTFALAVLTLPQTTLAVSLTL